MFGFSVLIIFAAALLGTGLTAVGLRVFFHVIEPDSAAIPLAGHEEY